MRGCKLPDVGQAVTDPTRRQDMLSGNAPGIGTLHPPLRSHTGLAADPQNPAGTRVLLRLEEGTHSGIGFRIASCQRSLGRTEPDGAVGEDKVERIDARPPIV